MTCCLRTMDTIRKKYKNVTGDQSDRYGLRTCQNNSSSIRYGGKDISFIRKNGHILRGGERMQVKGLFLNYKKNRRLMQYFFKIRELV